MNGIGILQRKTNHTNVSVVVGVAAVVGLSLVLIMPQTRKLCANIMNGALRRVKDKRLDAVDQKDDDWEDDLANAEKLKGPIDKRKVPAVKVPSAGTTAWKEKKG